MLEKPPLSDEAINTRLCQEYGVIADSLTFLPLGADVNTVVYRVGSAEGQAYFLKLRTGNFADITVSLPEYLHSQGIRSVIAPLETVSHRLYGSLEDYTFILYPFIEGQDGYEAAMSDQQWVEFGVVLRRIHALQLPANLEGRIPRETYNPAWREWVKEYQVLAEGQDFVDEIAGELAAFMRQRREIIHRLISRAEELGMHLQAHAREVVLCHADIHAGNLHLTPDGSLYIVDWDNPLFAPKEKDLALVGGCGTWRNPRQTALFYQGYGEAPIDRTALAYYRYERIIQDVAEFGKQLFLSPDGGANRPQSLAWCMGLFEAGNDVELAIKNDVDLI